MKKIIIITIGFVLCNIGMGFAQNYQLVTNVKTPNNSTVQYTYTLTSADMSPNAGQTAAYRAFLNSFGAVLIEPESYKYNCHGYAWNVSEGGSKIWMGRYMQTAEDIYWTDGSYMEVTESDATKVSYHQAGNHSAIKLDSYWYQSKWGWGEGLVKHTLTGIDAIYQLSMAKIFYKRTPPPTISGPNMIGGTTSASFTVTNKPASATLSWYYDTNLLTQVSSSANGIVLKPKTATTVGDATVRATLNYPGGVQRSVKPHTTKSVPLAAT